MPKWGGGGLETMEGYKSYIYISLNVYTCMCVCVCGGGGGGGSRMAEGESNYKLWSVYYLVVCKIF